MNSKHPAMFYPDLTDDKLLLIATELLDIRYLTIGEMNSPYDDNYTRETAVFGRSKNMLISLAQGGQHDWLSLRHAGMDVTINIGSVPCRFFRDDHDSPEKLGFFKRNAVDDLFATDDQHPVMWRFVVEKALTDDADDQVYFAGYNVYQEKVSEWIYSNATPQLHTVDKVVPAAVEILPAPVAIRDVVTSEQDRIEKTGSDE
jgi:hypothetical protein